MRRPRGAHNTPRPSARTRSPDMPNPTRLHPDDPDRLRAAARHLEHLADGDVPLENVPLIHDAVVNLLKQTGVIA